MNDRDRIISMRQNQIFVSDLHNGVTLLVTVTARATTGQYSLYYYRNIYPRVTVSLNHFLITAEHRCNAQYKPHEPLYQSRNGIVTIQLFSLKCQVIPSSFTSNLQIMPQKNSNLMKRLSINHYILPSSLVQGLENKVLHYKGQRLNQINQS